MTYNDDRIIVGKYTSLFVKKVCEKTLAINRFSTEWFESHIAGVYYHEKDELLRFKNPQNSSDSGRKMLQL